MRVTEATGYPEPRDSISHDWTRRLSGWGMTPLLIPNTATDPGAYMADLGLDIVVLTGGEDCGETPSRDATEAALLDHAIARKLPVLGVCRGLQFLNRHLGGRLTPVEGHAGGAHRVTVTPSWRDIYEAAESVNSYHAWAVEAAGRAPGLVPFATDDGGRAEGLCHEALPIAAVMWHPEREGAPAGDRLLVSRLAAEGAFWT